MFSFLKDHPFAVAAYFESSLVFTFAFRKEEIVHMIPGCLELDTFKDKWAFIAVAMVQTKHLRPEGFPKVLGSDFFLLGYRVFVRYTDKHGKRMRGLYILKSQTDKKRMELFGNIFTHYNYTTIDVNRKEHDGVTEICSDNSGFRVRFEERVDENISLPDGSPFVDWKEARKFAGPLPFTFTYDAANKTVLIIEGVRQNWKPSPVKVLDHHFSFLDGLKLSDPMLANAFIIRDVPYRWKSGRKDKWAGAT